MRLKSTKKKKKDYSNYHLLAYKYRSSTCTQYMYTHQFHVIMITRTSSLSAFTFIQVPNCVSSLSPSRCPQLDVQSCDATLLGQDRRILGSKHGSVGGGLGNQWNNTSYTTIQLRQ